MKKKLLLVILIIKLKIRFKKIICFSYKVEKKKKLFTERNKLKKSSKKFINQLKE